MQIHEITKRRLREGFVSDLKSVGSALKPSRSMGAGFVQGLTGADFPRQSKSASLERDTAERARELAQQWKKHVKTQRKPQAKSDATNSNWRQDALKAAGSAFNQAPAARPAPGQMPASVASSAQGQKMMQAYGQPRGGVQAIKEAPAEYTTPGGVIVPGVPTVDFERWADQQLTTQISGTGQKIDLDAVKKDPAVKAELDKVLPQIKKDPNNLAAVEMYFFTAMQAMQEMSNAIKQKQASGVK
jgi:hypothetical protein